MELIARDPAPQVVNLSAGSYTRNDWLLLSFSAFDYGGITLTAAAGNDATDRKFWPAAFDWAVGVGALGADLRNRAWFSNYGDWVDVYTPRRGPGQRVRDRGSTPTRSRRSAQRSRSSTGWRGGAAPRSPRRSSPA